MNFECGSLTFCFQRFCNCLTVTAWLWVCVDTRLNHRLSIKNTASVVYRPALVTRRQGGVVWGYGDLSTERRSQRQSGCEAGLIRKIHCKKYDHFSTDDLNSTTCGWETKTSTQKCWQEAASQMDLSLWNVNVTRSSRQHCSRLQQTADAVVDFFAAYTSACSNSQCLFPLENLQQPI